MHESVRHVTEILLWLL